MNDTFTDWGHKMALFRYECDGLGIFEKVSQQCPANDPSRINEPDSSWINKLKSNDPNSVSFWTLEGLNRYQNSQLADWHMSVISGDLKLIVATEVDNPHDSDSLQVIAPREKFKISKIIKCDYTGPHPFIHRRDNRPDCIRHEDTLMHFARYAWYPQSQETFTYGAHLGSSVGLKRHAVNIDYLPPESRSSWPHAHKNEEEMVTVLEGSVQFWVDWRSL